MLASSTATLIIGGWAALTLLVLLAIAVGGVVGTRRYFDQLGPSTQRALRHLEPRNEQRERTMDAPPEPLSRNHVVVFDSTANRPTSGRL